MSNSLKIIKYFSYIDQLKPNRLLNKTCCLFTTKITKTCRIEYARKSKIITYDCYLVTLDHFFVQVCK